MATLSNGTRNNYVLKSGRSLRVFGNAGGTGFVWLTSPNAQDFLAGVVTSQTEKIFGPYDDDQTFRVECTEGTIEVVNNLRLTRDIPSHWLAAEGDSRISQQYSTTGAGTTLFYTKENVGTLSYVEALSGGRVLIPRALNFGVSGNTSTDVAGRIAASCAAAKAAGAWGMIVLLGANDHSSGNNFPVKTTIDNYEFILQTIFDYKLVPVWVVDPGVGSSAFTGIRMSATQLAYWNQCRAWALDLRKRQGVLVVDAYRKLHDLTVTTGDLLASMTSDGTHYTPLGAYTLANEIVTQINQFIAPVELLPSASEVYSVNNPKGVITANPWLQGTGGNVQAGSGGSGSLAPSWTVLFNNANRPGLSVAYSKVTTADGLPAQQVAITGTPTGAGQYDGFTQTISLATYPPGTKLRGVALIEVDAGAANITGLNFGFEGNADNSQGFSFFRCLAMDFGASPIPNLAHRMMMVTEDFVIPPSCNGLTLTARAYFVQNAAASLTWRLIAGGAMIVP